MKQFVSHNISSLKYVFECKFHRVFLLTLIFVSRDKELTKYVGYLK